MNNVLGILSDWKTTVAGVVAFAGLLLGQLDVINITPEQQNTIVAFAVLVIGALAGDAKSGEKIKQDKKK